MNIGISTSVIQQGRTGIAQYLFALVRELGALLKEGDRLHLFVLEKDAGFFESARSFARLIPVEERYRAPVQNILWHQTQLPRISRSLRLDVLHIPSYRRLLWPRPCALVGTIHDLAPFRVEHKYDWKRMFYGRVVAKRLAARQHRLIAVSHNTARDLHQFFRIPQERIRVIVNGLDHERFRPLEGGESKEIARRAWGLERPFFLYVARLEHPAKNHWRLLEAFDRFKRRTGSHWQLILGGSDWHGAENIHRRIGQSPFRSDIKCLGFVEEGDLSGLYRAADAFVYPSLYEGFGMPPVEAMACGCPVISSRAGSLQEVVGTAAKGVDPDSVEQLEAALAEFAENDELRQQYGRAGVERARIFQWRTTASETLNVYREAIGVSARGSG